MQRLGERQEIFELADGQADHKIRLSKRAGMAICLIGMLE
jgi:hypothetical protein